MRENALLYKNVIVTDIPRTVVKCYAQLLPERSASLTIERFARGPRLFQLSRRYLPIGRED